LTFRATFINHLLQNISPVIVKDSHKSLTSFLSCPLWAREIAVKNSFYDRP
jgi:hypothetical protein